MSLVFNCLQGEKLLKNFNNEVKGGGESILYIGIRYLGNLESLRKLWNLGILVFF